MKLVDGVFKTLAESALPALNARLRDAYVVDCQKGVRRWNKVIVASGVDFRITLPHLAFNRAIGVFKGVSATPAGDLLDAGEWMRRRDQWLPTGDDAAFIASLTTPEVEPGAYAGWIAPPRHGINNMPGDFEYVRLARP
jgi:benzoyl-CoA 2,3-dioxygenase component B